MSEFMSAEKVGCRGVKSRPAGAARTSRCCVGLSAAGEAPPAPLTTRAQGGERSVQDYLNGRGAGTWSS